MSLFSFGPKVCMLASESGKRKVFERAAGDRRQEVEASMAAVAVGSLSGEDHGQNQLVL